MKKAVFYSVILLLVFVATVSAVTPQSTSLYYIPLFVESTVSQGGGLDAPSLPIHRGTMLTWQGDYYYRNGDLFLEAQFKVRNLSPDEGAVRLFAGNQVGLFRVPAGFDGEGRIMVTVQSLPITHHVVALRQWGVETESVSVWVGR